MVIMDKVIQQLHRLGCPVHHDLVVQAVTDLQSSPSFLASLESLEAQPTSTTSSDAWEHKVTQLITKQVLAVYLSLLWRPSDAQTPPDSPDSSHIQSPSVPATGLILQSVVYLVDLISPTTHCCTRCSYPIPAISQTPVTLPSGVVVDRVQSQQQASGTVALPGISITQLAQLIPSSTYEIDHSRGVVTTNIISLEQYYERSSSRHVVQPLQNRIQTSFTTTMTTNGGSTPLSTTASPVVHFCACFLSLKADPSTPSARAKQQVSSFLSSYQLYVPGVFLLQARRCVNASQPPTTQVQERGGGDDDEDNNGDGDGDRNDGNPDHSTPAGGGGWTPPGYKPHSVYAMMVTDGDITISSTTLTPDIDNMICYEDIYNHSAQTTTPASRTSPLSDSDAHPSTAPTPLTQLQRANHPLFQYFDGLTDAEQQRRVDAAAGQSAQDSQDGRCYVIYTNNLFITMGSILLRSAVILNTIRFTKTHQLKLQQDTSSGNSAFQTMRSESNDVAHLSMTASSSDVATGAYDVNLARNDTVNSARHGPIKRPHPTTMEGRYHPVQYDSTPAMLDIKATRDDDDLSTPSTTTATSTSYQPRYNPRSASLPESTVTAPLLATSGQHQQQRQHQQNQSEAPASTAHSGVSSMSVLPTRSHSQLQPQDQPPPQPHPQSAASLPELCLQLGASTLSLIPLIETFMSSLMVLSVQFADPQGGSPRPTSAQLLSAVQASLTATIHQHSPLVTTSYTALARLFYSYQGNVEVISAALRVYAQQPLPFHHLAMNDRGPITPQSAMSVVEIVPTPSSSSSTTSSLAIQHYFSATPAAGSPPATTGGVGQPLAFLIHCSFYRCLLQKADIMASTSPQGGHELIWKYSFLIQDSMQNKIAIRLHPYWLSLIIGDLGLRRTSPAEFSRRGAKTAELIKDFKGSAILLFPPDINRDIAVISPIMFGETPSDCLEQSYILSDDDILNNLFPIFTLADANENIGVHSIFATSPNFRRTGITEAYLNQLCNHNRLPLLIPIISQSAMEAIHSSSG